MPGHKRFSETFSYTAAALFVCGVSTWGCGPQEQGSDAVEIVCDGQGVIHNDHCHCATGYTSTEDGLGCVEREDLGPDPDPGSGGGALTFAPTSVRSAVAQDDAGQTYWVVEGLDGGAHIQIELYPEYGGPDSAGHHVLNVDDESYATCGTCVVLRTGCVLSNGFYDCDRTFMPAAGAVFHADQMGTEEGSKIVARLEDVTFEQVTIAQDFSTAPVDNGVSHTLERWAFDVVLGGVNTEPECSGQGHMHGNTCHCNPGYSVDPGDPTKCVAAEPECSGRGHLHGGTCHCDPGFQVDPNDSTKCVSSGAGQECSGRGHMHGGTCHCDPGFQLDPNDPTRCI